MPRPLTDADRLAKYVSKGDGCWLGGHRQARERGRSTMAKDHLSLRIDPELRAVVDAMADHREIHRTTMIERMLAAAVSSKQRTCKVTHKVDERCGECGLTLDGDTRNTYEKL